MRSRIGMGFLCLGLFACEAGTNDLLDETDTGVTARDAGDSGVEGVDAATSRDAEADGGTSRLCPEPNTFGIIARGFADDTFMGPMQLTATGEDLLLVDASGQRELVLTGHLPQSLALERSYLVAVELDRPFWVEVRITLWFLDASGASDGVAFMAWQGGSFGSAQVEDVGYEYEIEACILDDDFCGLREGLRMVADVRGERTRVARGLTLPDVGYEIFNGRSERFVDSPNCLDVPVIWHEGWIYADRRGPQPCRQLHRDACIWDARCTLWGSEVFDPGYVCLAATGICEVITDSTTCRNTASCQWNPGDCYCPEGVRCVCAGGPAPKCQSVCGGFAGFVCPDGRYCENLITAQQCRLVPDVAGQCQWRPDDCTGTPNRSACGCTLEGAVSYPNDCLRRQAMAAPISNEACGN